MENLNEFLIIDRNISPLPRRKWRKVYKKLTSHRISKTSLQFISLVIAVIVWSMVFGYLGKYITYEYFTDCGPNWCQIDVQDSCPVEKFVEGMFFGGKVDLF